MINFYSTKFMSLADQFQKKFNDIIPTMQIPSWENEKGLFTKIRYCLKTGVNNLTEVYKWNNTDLY